MSRAREESGWVMATVVIVGLLMFLSAFALLAIVDVQTRQSRLERLNDSSFNLAEGAMNAQAFRLSRSWPGSANTAFTTSCTQTSTERRCPSTDEMRDSFKGGDFDGSTWQTDVRDNGVPYDRSWNEAAMSQPAWDANGDGQVWVRSRAVVSAVTESAAGAGDGRRGVARAMVARVKVNQPPALPIGFGLVTGRFKTDLGVTLNQAVANDVLTRTMQSQKLVSGGKIGLRCAVAPPSQPLDACVTGTFSVLSAAQRQALIASDVVHVNALAAASDDVIAQLRQRALDTGTYHQTLAAGAVCPSGSTDSIVFVEQIGDGDGVCTVTLSGGTTQVRALVVAQGRVTFNGTGIYQGVVYVTNRQRQALGDASPEREVVRIEGNARIVGTIAVDGRWGSLGIYPPAPTTAGFLSQLVLCQTTPAVCAPLYALSLQQAVDAVTPLTSPVDIGNALFSAGLLGYGPAVSYDATVVNALKAYGSAGTVQNSFRQIPTSP